MADKKDTVKVESIKWHTHDGKAYDVGQTYDAPADLVESLALQGMALRVDRADVAKAQAREAEKSRQSKSTKVEPMGLESPKAVKAPKAAKPAKAEKAPKVTRAKK